MVTMLPKTKAIKVLLLDQPCAFRDLLRRELAREGGYKLFETGPVDDLVAPCERLAVQVLICNPEVMAWECAGAIRNLRQALPHLRVLLLAPEGMAARSRLVAAVHAGADGCVLRSEPLEQLLLTLQVVASGGRCLSPQTQALMSDTAITAVSKLTGRQCEVLRLIAEGFSTKEISCRLNVSVKTADHHRSRVMKRLNLHDAASTVRFAIRTGLVVA